MINFSVQLKLVSDYVTGLFHALGTPELVYHNLSHTQTVVERAAEIAANYSLTEQDLFILLSAAWFHDCGHLYGAPKGHEQRSVDIMRRYMQSADVESDRVADIEACILSTKMGSVPGTLTQAILCDADLYHLGTISFLTTNELVRVELERRGYSLPGNYDESTLNMLKRHHFFTAYCRELLNDGKRKNIQYIEEMIAGPGTHPE